MNVCGMSFSGWMDGFAHRNFVLSGISGVLPIKLSVVSLALLCVCFDTMYTTVLPHIVIPPEPRVIAVVRGGQPNTTFICEATGVPTPRISWMHNGRNISQSIDDRFQADITVSTGGTVRSMLNATHLRGRDSGRIDCVAYCIVSEEQPLSFSNTTLSVLSKLPAV